MMYSQPRFIEKQCGNNSFAYRPGRKLYVPMLAEGGFCDVKPGDRLVFEEFENDELVSSAGLERFILAEHEGRNVYIFDNHNHALAFWCDAVRKGIISPGFELVHVDQHSDLRHNENVFNPAFIEDDSYVEAFVDEKTNVGNYITPALACGFISNVMRIEGEQALDRLDCRTICKNSVLNLDLDFFAPCMDFIPFEKKKQAVLEISRSVRVITVATSPFFIDQNLAIRRMMQVFGTDRYS